jgi:predicted RNase H-like HicB family nuclease
MKRLALHVEVHHENGSYWAEAPQLPGCFAAGQTVADLLDSVEEAVALYLAPAEPDELPIAIKLVGLEVTLRSGQPLAAPFLTAG